jgi:hypothetical protein
MGKRGSKVQRLAENTKLWRQERFDKLEGRFQKNLMTMAYNGGINVRDEVKRRKSHW